MKTQISIGHWNGKRVIRLFALILALAIAAPVLLAQESPRLTGRDKHDPTGAWLLRTPFPTGPDGQPGAFILTVFHQGGTLTGDIQGESAFDPADVDNPNSVFNIISSPQSGVWQKTGQNTFAATFLLMEYHVLADPIHDAPLFRFDRVQYTGTLNKSGDAMTIDALLTFFDEQGNRIDDKGKPSTDFVVEFNANGVRIPLTGNSLPIPPIPPSN